MKKTIILLMLAFLPTLLMAQAAGAHVVRKPKTTAVAPKPKPAPKPQAAPKPKPKQRVQLSNRYSQAEKDRIIQNLVNNMVYVAGGTFTMGDTSGLSIGSYPSETPAHQVTLSSFSIGKYEVTQEEWEAVMGSNPSKDKGLNRPVDKVNWNDCQTFIRKLNQLTGKQFRLPTEAEWEYAARGGKQSKHYKYAGSSDIGSVAWYGDNSGGETHPVGQKQANELGLYDMTGNVWEWCQDRCGNYSSSAQTNPTGPSSGDSRVGRGGSVHPSNSASSCRVTSRSTCPPRSRSEFIGLRLAL